MISDEEIKRVAVETKSFELNEEFITFWGIDATEEVMAFARAIYQLGRQRQRESDAALCGNEEHRHWHPRKFAEAIRNNTGELK